jgi:hypothetical protein
MIGRRQPVVFVHLMPSAVHCRLKTVAEAVAAKCSGLGLARKAAGALDQKQETK